MSKVDDKRKHDAMQVHRMLKEDKIFEQRIGYERMIESSRLPQIITIRRGLFRKFTYNLHYGEIDDHVYISYSEESLTYKTLHKVLLHYEEATMRDCIAKTWRYLAENRVKVPKQYA